MKNVLKYSIVVILFLQTVFLFGQALLPNTTGSFVYTPTGPLSTKPITVYYHIPNGNISTMPILLSFHGDDRDGSNYRDYWISMANANGFMVFAPEYSDANYPGGDGYQLGNVFVDGDNPSLATYNPENEWTFSTVDPLFESIKTRVSGSQATYDAWGHSGGAQFLQRFRLYLPNSKMNTAICSNAGWYTVPETGIDFPYGIDKSELTTTNFTDAFPKRLIVHLGQNDTDPNSPGLRHNPTVDNQQGLNRLDRGRYFYTESLAYAQSISSTFNWQKQEVAGVGHDPQLMANNALTYLFQSNSNAISSTTLDGGFENQPNSLPGGTGGILVISPTNWTANTTGNIVRTTSDTGGRTGPRCAQFGTTSTGAKTFFSPQLPGAFAPNTTYQVQFFYKPTVTIGTVASSSINLYVDNELANPAGTVQSVAAGLSASASTATWTKIAVQITTNGTVAGSNGVAAIAFTTSGTTPNFAANFDDFAVYQGSAPDITAPNSPGAITATVASNSVANVSWATANGGFDGGGYMVVRYATSTAPSASDDPIQNGIYNVNNTIGAGVVRYIGTATSFTDSGLTAGTDYFYKVYTLDKAFNYSNESTTTNPINSLAIYYYKGTGSLAILTNWGTNTDGTGIAPSNFTADFQVFEIRNTSAVATDALWTVGGNSKVVIGASTVGAVTFTISSGFALSLGTNARLDIAAASSGNNEVIFQNAILPTLGTVDGSANITYANDGTGIAITSIACNTLKISNSTDVSLNNNPSCKFLVVDAGSSITATTQVITLASGGSATINGTYSANRAAGLFTTGTVTSTNRGNIHSDDTNATVTLGPNSKIIFSRTTAQTIAPLIYADIEIRGSGVVLTTDITVNNNLTMGSGATVTLNAGKNLTVGNAIANAGTLTIKSNANLIQTNNIPNTGAGITNVERDSSPLFRLDYTLWSSPVAGTQKLLDFSPLTDTDRFYIYNEGTDEYNSVVPSTTNFGAGKGYLIRMPDNSVPFPGTPAPWTGTFTGTTPNNGNLTLAMTTALNGYNAVGNPYPSTLNIDDFIEANTITNNNIDGALYFWRKTNDASNPTSYSTCTTLGITSGNTHNYPDANLMSPGQGFFVKAISNSLNFTNAMRVANTTNQFFRTKQIERNRIWLNLSKGATVVNQMLVGYMTGSTPGIDKGIDGKYFNDSPTALNSIISNEEFAIQGRSLPFDAADTVPLAFKTDVAGDYIINIDQVDGLFSGSQDIYLVDSKTGAETNLKTSSYPFTAAVGVDNTRFSLRFQKTLNVAAVAFNDNSVSVYKNKETLHINSEALAIANIKVFDIQGRLIAERNNVKANSATISNLKTTQQVLIVKVTGQDNAVVSKKIVN
jgi:hypothetical protein